LRTKENGDHSRRKQRRGGPWCVHQLKSSIITAVIVPEEGKGELGGGTARETIEGTGDSFGREGKKGER